MARDGATEIKKQQVKVEEGGAEAIAMGMVRRQKREQARQYENQGVVVGVEERLYC